MKTLNEQLMYAAAGGRLEEIASLLEQGADIDHVDGPGDTPLTKAIIKGQEATAAFLLEHGAKVNRQVRAARARSSFARRLLRRARSDGERAAQLRRGHRGD